VSVMAELSDPRFLPLVERKLKTASAHEKTRLAACARACGKPADRIVEIDVSRPVTSSQNPPGGAPIRRVRRRLPLITAMV